MAFQQQGPKQPLYIVRFPQKQLWHLYDGSADDTVDAGILCWWWAGRVFLGGCLEVADWIPTKKPQCFSFFFSSFFLFCVTCTWVRFRANTFFFKKNISYLCHNRYFDAVQIYTNIGLNRHLGRLCIVLVTSISTPTSTRMDMSTNTHTTTHTGTHMATLKNTRMQIRMNTHMVTRTSIRMSTRMVMELLTMEIVSSHSICICFYSYCFDTLTPDIYSRSKDLGGTESS